MSGVTLGVDLWSRDAGAGLAAAQQARRGSARGRADGPADAMLALSPHNVAAHGPHGPHGPHAPMPPLAPLPPPAPDVLLALLSSNKALQGEYTYVALCHPANLVGDKLF